AATHRQAVVLQPYGARPAAGTLAVGVVAAPPGVGFGDARLGQLAALLAATPPGVPHVMLNAQLLGAGRAELLDPSRALLHLRRPHGGALGAALREDLDHAGRRFRPVQGGRRGSLDDLDAVDVVRVDVVERAHRDERAAASGEIRSVDGRERAVHHAHAVDVDDRLVGHGHRRVAAKADLLALADLAAAAGDLHARSRAL